MDMQPASIDMLKALLDAFNAHDLDRIMSFFSDDCVLEMPRGPYPWGAVTLAPPRLRRDCARDFRHP